MPWVYTQSRLLGCNSNFIFILLRHLHTLFHSAYTNLYFHQQYTRLPFSPHFCRECFLCFILITAILTSGSDILLWIWICISLIISDIECFFHTPVDHVYCPMSSLQKCLLSSFLNYLLFSFIVGIVDTLCKFPIVLDINPLSDIWFTNIFSHSVCCPFILLVFSLL